ncbi:DUF6612 family protein [Lactobacillus sp. ESL0677]|uniref:DUF6612 family protein n=1 Tax=Lactobacillus sp. ESL0677 TaxID=2983208 RepID=UPI0023F64913|nr:DUF6612 family protein [Lactobacillus sp. ESL0677]WEV36832.1 hypothetical protein OZX76_08855 [Lactobacillus sp. ESL0677]
MKFKKTVITLLAAIGLGALGTTATQPVAASTSKADVIKVTQQDLAKATDTKAAIKFGIKTGKKQLKFNGTMTMGNKPIVVHMVANSKLLPTSVEEWVDSGTGKVYVLSGKTWIKDDMSKEDLASFTDTTQAATNPAFYKKLAKKAKLTHSGDAYTVSGKITDQKWLSKIMLDTAKSTKLSKKEQKSLKKQLKKTKFKNVSVKMTTTNDKLTDYKLSAKVGLSKKISFTFSMDMSEFGQHSDLAVPSDIVSSATQAPKD